MIATPLNPSEELFMLEALKEAKKAYAKDEVPIGAVIVHDNRIIARAHNQVEMLKDPTAHAEMLAITQAASYLECKWLTDCFMFVTIEPCSMCAGALVLARLKGVVFGAADPKAGACGSVVDIVQHEKLNHRLHVKQGILQDDCRFIMKDFFEKKRKVK